MIISFLFGHFIPNNHNKSLINIQLLLKLLVGVHIKEDCLLLAVVQLTDISDFGIHIHCSLFTLLIQEVRFVI